MNKMLFVLFIMSVIFLSGCAAKYASDEMINEKIGCSNNCLDLYKLKDATANIGEGHVEGHFGGLFGGGSIDGEFNYGGLIFAYENNSEIILVYVTIDEIRIIYEDVVPYVELIYKNENQRPHVENWNNDTIENYTENDWITKCVKLYKIHLPEGSEKDFLASWN